MGLFIFMFDSSNTCRTQWSPFLKCVLSLTAWTKEMQARSLLVA